MSWYDLARPLLFALEPESANRLALKVAGFIGFAIPSAPPCPVRVMDLEFPNPVGLAAGLDKDAEHIDALAALGFGFIEVGTVTPRPQPGNPRPRLFRLPQARALINRLGFNNVGLDEFMQNIGRARWRGILGINIGKNFDTPMERAAGDYEICLERVYAKAAYIAVNVSSPNTEGLRSLQERDPLENLLARLAAARARLADRHGRRVPLVLKVAPDLDAAQVSTIAAAVRRHGFDGVIATNTSVSREGVQGMPHAAEQGGLSGAPLLKRATQIQVLLVRELKGEVAVIGVGGILSGADAAQKMAAGASLVQLYTGLVYRGPELVGECISACRERSRTASSASR